ncbi:MAG TPA: hypothetical protein VHP99_16820 [Pyrinomonadaceae bacterium]|jgi:hypothetical protein|nr:hypothetical protein [Pyrinomonadaceae bacterium]
MRSSRQLNQKTFYRTRNLAITDKEGMFTCFVDNTGLWQCAAPPVSGRKERRRRFASRNRLAIQRLVLLDGLAKITEDLNLKFASRSLVLNVVRS